MPYHLSLIVQFMPDWMVGGVLKSASFAAAGSGMILAVIADTPASMLLTVLGLAVGVYIAHVNRSAVRERDRIAIKALEAEVDALKNYNLMLASHVGSDELKAIRADAKL